MLRFENKVPAVYVRESRDFQLFIAVLDYLQNSLKWRIDEIATISDTRRIPDTLLKYLKTKLGYISNFEFSETYVRYILRVFGEAVKCKGSKIGIYKIVNAFLNSQSIQARVEIAIINKKYDRGTYIDADSYIVDIRTTTTIPNKQILEDALQFVIPAGYQIRYTILLETVYSDELGVTAAAGYEELTNEDVIHDVDPARVGESGDNLDVTIRSTTIHNTNTQS